VTPIGDRLWPRVTSATSEAIFETVDVEDFLSRPLVARVAAIGPHGPTIRPVWFLYERREFWWLTGSSYSRLGDLISQDPRVSMTIDTCDLDTGEVFALTVVGRAVVHAFDAELAKRKLAKYLGPDFNRWDRRFRDAFDDCTTRLVSLKPDHPLRLRDLSFVPSHLDA